MHEVISGLRQACVSCGLRETCLPAGIPADSLRLIDAAVRQRRPLRAREVLFHAGAGFECLYLVRSGALMSCSHAEDGSEQVQGFHLPGELLGLDGLAEGRHGCSVIALEASNVCALPLVLVQDIVVDVPELQAALMRVIARESANDHLHVAMMGRRGAHERLAAFLISLSERHARIGRDPLRLRLYMSRSEIGSFLGLAEETVSRLFSRMHAGGLLEVHGRTVRIRDEEGLRLVCHGHSETAVSAPPRRRRELPPA